MATHSHQYRIKLTVLSTDPSPKVIAERLMGRMMLLQSGDLPDFSVLAIRMESDGGDGQLVQDDREQLKSENELLTNEVARLNAVLASHQDDPTSAGFQFTPEEREMMKRRDKIGAIKSLRSRLYLSLVDAKRLADRWRG
jgi:hypothetical protein